MSQRCAVASALPHIRRTRTGPGSPWGLLPSVCVALLALTPSIAALERDPPAMSSSWVSAGCLTFPDTFADGLSRRLVLEAVGVRREAANSERGQVLMSSRIRVAVNVPGKPLARVRSLYHREELASLETRKGAGVAKQVLERRRGAPLIGDRVLGRRGPLGLALDPEDGDQPLLGLVSLSLASIAPDLPLDSGIGEYQVLEFGFPDPLSPGGVGMYRFRSAGGVSLDLPGPGLFTVVDVESLGGVSPEIRGSLWFEEKSGRLVRALYRPRGRWKLSAGLRSLARKVPVVPKDALGEVDYLVVDFEPDSSGLLRPVRIQLEGQISWIWTAIEMPVTFEWTGRWVPLGSLGDPSKIDPAIRLPPPLRHGWDVTVTRNEFSPYLRELDRVSLAPPAPTLRETLFRIPGSLRFNWVQGLSAEVVYPLPLGAQRLLTAKARFSTTGFPPTGELGLSRRRFPLRWGVEAYTRLEVANRWDSALSIGNSIDALLFGYDDGNYYRASGGAAWLGWTNHPLRLDVRLYAERHQAEQFRTDFSLGSGGPESPGGNIQADEGTFYGVRSMLHAQFGEDPQVGVLLARLWGELGWGESAYQDLGAEVEMVLPLAWRLAGALRLGCGRAWGTVPVQRNYFLGGSNTLRAFPGDAAIGEAFYLARAEVGSDVPGLRIVMFGDLGLAEDPQQLFDSRPLASAGLGLSILDGMVRFDLARGLKGGGEWRLHMLSYGIF